MDGIPFSVRRGEVSSLLGPDGAGKTTTIGVLTTRVLATPGAASVAGVDVEANPALSTAAGVRGSLRRALDRRRWRTGGREPVEAGTGTRMMGRTTRRSSGGPHDRPSARPVRRPPAA